MLYLLNRLREGPQRRPAISAKTNPNFIIKLLLRRDRDYHLSLLAGATVDSQQKA